MPDRSSERDRRVRQLLSNKSSGMGVIGQAQAEIQDAQSELQNQVAMQQAQDQSRLRQTQTISQAAQGMLSMENGNNQQLQAQAASMNPATQATLGRYGVKPSRTQNNSRNTATSRVVSKSGDITNVKNENITNNRTEIKVTQPAIPMQAPAPRVVNTGGGGGDNTSKFKAWLSGMFAQQQNEAEIQRKEYRKKEWSLSRTTSKLMQKIGETTTDLGNKLNPQNMKSTLGGQLKWLLLIFGATMIGKVWKPAMKVIANIEAGFRSVFGLPVSEDLKANASGTFSIMDKVKAAIGINDENESLISGLGKVITQGFDKLIDKLTFWFEDRANAMKSIEFPSTKVELGGLSVIPGLSDAFDGVISTFKGIGQYLGDIISVAFGGSKGKVRVEARKVERQVQTAMTNTSGKVVSVGDEALINGQGRNYMKESDYNAFGQLKGNASSTQAMSQSLISLFNDGSGKSHTAEIATGVSQLFDTAKREGQVVIDPSLFKYLGLSAADIQSLRSGGMLQQKQYRIIGVKPNRQQETEMGIYNGHQATSDFIKAGTVSGGIIGAAEGGILGAGAGVLIGGAVGTAVGGLTDAAHHAISKWSKSGLYPILVPAESDQRSADGSRGVPKTLWVLNKEGANAVIGKFTKNMNNKDMDLTNTEFYSKIRSLESDHARRTGRTLKYEAINTNNLKVTQAQYGAYQKEYYNRFESTDPGSQNMLDYGRWNAFSNTMGNAFDAGRTLVAGGLTTAGTWVKGQAITSGQQKQRAAYVMKKAMEMGFTKEQAAGIVGNLMQESSLSPETNYSSNDGGEPSGGLASWRGDNAKEVLRYARDLYGCNVDPNNIKDITKIPFDVQADILLRQLRGDLHYWTQDSKKFNLVAGMRNARTVEEATNVMERNFEISGDYTANRNAKRISYAQGFYGMDVSGVDTTQAPESIGTPLTNGEQGVMNGKTGSMPKSVKDWLWGGNAPKTYNPADKPYAESLMTQVSVPIHNLSDGGKPAMRVLTVNAKIANDVVAIFQEIFKEVPVYKIKYESLYCFSFRGAYGYTHSTNLSNHGLGAAIDINGAINPRHDHKTIDTDTHLGTKNHPVVQIFARHGWLWGGNWRLRDTMHFEFGGTPKSVGSMAGGLLSGALNTVGNALISAGEAIDPNTPKKDGSTALTSKPLTKEQKAAIKTATDYNKYSESVQIGSLKDVGVQEDNRGLYLALDDNYRAYLKPGTTALNGTTLSGDDVDFVGKWDPKTDKINPVTDNEERTVKGSVTYTVASLLSTYEGKGSANDRLKGKDGQEISFFLGEFDDIDSFSENARTRLGRLSDGKIKYYVFPSKDATSITKIEIRPTFSSGIGSISTNDIKAWRKDLTDEGIDFAKRNNQTVGPTIYEKGRKWVNVLTEKFSKLTDLQDWQPAAWLNHVFLTPNAKLKKQELLQSLGKIIEGKGNELSEEAKAAVWESSSTNSSEIVNALGTAKAVLSSENKFDVDAYFSRLEIKFKDRNKFFKDHKDIFSFREGKIIGPGGAVWGTYDEKDPNKVTLYNEDEFKSEQERLGNKGLAENDKKNKQDQEIKLSAAMGYSNKDAAATFLYNTFKDLNKTKERTLLSQAYVKRKGVKSTKGGGDLTGYLYGVPYMYNMFLNPDGTIEHLEIRGSRLKDLFSGIVKKINPKAPTELPILPTIKANTEEDLKKKIIDEIQPRLAQALTKQKEEEDKKLPDDTKTDSKAGVYYSTSIFNDVKKKLKYENTGTLGDQKFDPQHAPTPGKLFQRQVQIGKKVAKITPQIEYGSQGYGHSGYMSCTGIDIEYENGEKETINSNKEKIYIYEENNLPGLVKRINAQIDQSNKQLARQKVYETWDNSDYKRSLDELYKKYKAGKLEGVTKKDGKLYAPDGTVFGTYSTKEVGKGKKKKTVEEDHSLTKEDLDKNDKLYTEVIENAGADYFKDRGNKIKYYQQLGGKLINGEVYFYSKNGTFRTKVDLSKNVTEDLSSVLSRKSMEIYDSKQKKFITASSVKQYGKYDKATGKFEDTGWWGGSSDYSAENMTNIGMEEINNNLKEINGNISIGAEYEKAVAGHTNKIETESEKQTKLEYINKSKQASILAEQVRQTGFLEVIKEHTLNPDKDEDELKTLLKGYEGRASQYQVDVDWDRAADDTKIKRRFIVENESTGAKKVVVLTRGGNYRTYDPNTGEYVDINTGLGKGNTVERNWYAGDKNKTTTKFTYTDNSGDTITYNVTKAETVNAKPAVAQTDTTKR